jgi:hypothetical protein
MDALASGVNPSTPSVSIRDGQSQKKEVSEKNYSSARIDNTSPGTSGYPPAVRLQ